MWMLKTIANLPFTKNQLCIQSCSVDVCTGNRVLFFEETGGYK